MPPSSTPPRRNPAHGATPSKPSYRIFDVHLKEKVYVSPSLARLVFTGSQVHQMGTCAPDQRIKLLFPSPDGQPAQVPAVRHWHQLLRDLPPSRRPPMRTYTLRALRRGAAEVDVEFVLHGENGPASRWATHAKPGDRLQMVAPCADHVGDPGGYEWQPPEGIRHVLLIADETALPAIAGIFESLASLEAPPRVQAFIEVPHAGDRLSLAPVEQAQVNWLVRDAMHLEHGEGMLQAARELALLPESAARQTDHQPLVDVDIERQLLWELATPTNRAFYAWVAGETAAVMAIRKHLINEVGLDRRALTLMGYWRLGRALD